MGKKLCYVLGVVTTMLSPSLFAMSDAEIEARFKQYEAKIEALEARLRTSGSPVYEEDLARQVKKNDKKLRKLNDKIAAEEERLRMNGFITAGVAMADDPLGTAYNFDDRPNFNGDSKIGMQFDYRLDDRADVTIQLVARSRDEDSWNVDAEWAYIGYKVTDDLKLRMGKLRVPFYMYSETLDVGYSYPWVRPPTEVYNTIFNSYNGADALYKFRTGSVNHLLQFFVSGSASTDNRTGNVDTLQDLNLRDLYGVNLTSDWGDFTWRLMASTISIEGEAGIRTDSQFASFTAIPNIPHLGLPAESIIAAAEVDSCDRDITGIFCAPGGYLRNEIEDTVDYYSTGAQYDNGSLFVLGEIALLRTEKGQLFSNEDQGYVTAGYRFGDFVPYYTYGRVYSKEGTDSAQRSNSLGLRYGLTPSVAAKFEWNHFYDFENNGNFASSLSLGSSADLYTFTLDAVF